MGLSLTYPDSVTFYTATSSGYRGSKVAVEAEEIACFFLQNTGFVQGDKQEAIDSDAILYPDFEDTFIVDNANRLEGMYIVAPEFGGEADKSWYKIISCTINRDHLLNNQIDNIECLLTKVSPLINSEIS